VRIVPHWSPKQHGVAPPTIDGHVTGLHGAQVPPVHTVLKQSSGDAHFSEEAHLPHSSPPQSTSVSVPSRVPFEQFGPVWQ
jgi:hypothetical protein